MKVAFRADASVSLGTGHVMRCLTLADRLREEWATTRLICQPLPGHLGDLIAARGHDLAFLPACDSKDQDAAACRQALADEALWDWLVVDHYGLDAAWERRMRSVAGKIMVIDDLADRPHDCDLLLDQNLQAEGRYAGLIPDACLGLIGPKYALLRPQFAAARQRMHAREGRVARLLVFFGGTDVGGETLKALEAIRMLGRPELAVDCVIGQANPHRAAIEAACHALPNATLYCQVDDMASRMAAADLFVGAGGTSSWERCCLGLPALVIATADNQIAQAEAIARAGAQLCLGAAQSVGTEHLARMIGAVLGLPELLAHMGERGQSLADGHGVGRVADRLLADELRLRRAGTDDSAAIHAWRNHPDTRRHALDPAEIDQANHEGWFLAVLADPNRELLIAEHGGHPVGVLRYDITAGRALVSIYLVPGLAGKGWGRRLLLAGEDWLRKERPDVVVCDAEITAANTASLALFSDAGFRLHCATVRKDIHGKS